MIRFVSDCPLIMLKCFEEHNNQTVLQDLPFISGLYSICFKSKSILDILKPESSVQLFSNKALGEKALNMLSGIYLSAVDKFASPKFGYSVWKLSMLKEQSFLSSSISRSSVLRAPYPVQKRNFFVSLLSFALSYLVLIPWAIFNFLSRWLGLKRFDPVLERSEAFELERVMDKEFQIEMFKDQFKDDLKQIGALWGYSNGHTEHIFKNTHRTRLRAQGTSML